MTLCGEYVIGFRQEGAGFSGSVPFIVSRKGYRLELDESQQEQIEPSLRQFYLLDMSRYFRAKSSEWFQSRSNNHCMAMEAFPDVEIVNRAGNPDEA